MTELDMWLGLALNYKATDILMSEAHPPRLRIDGDVVAMNNASPLPMEGVVKDLISRLNPEQQAISNELLSNKMDVDCSFGHSSGARIRANIYRTVDGRAIALRVIPAKRLTAKEIGLPDSVMKMCNARSGLFIVTGPNGSGKTTTLTAMLDVINETRPVHIVTIEDPIEYILHNKRAWISQRELRTHIADFRSAVRSVVRENPNVIVLGEIRDPDSTRTALDLAETGHLVLATMHTRDSISTVERLIGQFDSAMQPQVRVMLSENLLGVLAQLLIPKKGGGLVASFEVMLSSSSVRNMIREQKLGQMASVLQTSQKRGMISMEESLKLLEKRGLINSAEEHIWRDF